MSIEETTNSTAPVLSAEERLEIINTRKYMFDLLAMLAAPVIMAWYYYGQRALWLIILSVLTALACDFFGSKIVKSSPTMFDFSAVVTGVCVALCVSASAPWWLPCVASAFAIIVGKLPFGNARTVMFSTPAVGLAFITICNTKEMFAYPIIPVDSSSLAAFGNAGFIEGNSVAAMLVDKNSIGINIISYIDILVGNIPGAMGATCAVALMGALVYLIFRRPKTSVITLSYLLVCAVLAFAFPRVTTGRMISVVMELTGGLLFFCGLFLLTNEVIAPKRMISRVAYGAAAGVIVMLLRNFGSLEDSSVFAVLLANAVAPVFDKYIPLTKKEKKKAAEYKQKQILEAEQKKAEELEAQAQAQLVKALEEEKIKTRLEEEQKAAQAAQEMPQEEDDDVPTLQDLGEIQVADENENGGDADV